MSKDGTSPEFERELKELAAKSAHMYTRRNESSTPVIPAEAAWHGTLGGYTNHKCRCERCTAANTAYMADARARRKAAAKSPRDPRHGTAAFYGNHGCRCAKCRAAWTADITEDARNRKKAS